MREIRSRLNQLLSDYRLVESQVRQEQEQLVEVDEKVYSSEQAHKIIQEVAQVVQQEAHHRIASVVSRCLEAVFDDPYQFKIEFEQKRGRTEASLKFVRNGMEVDPLSASGGGVVDVAAFALRLACLILLRPPVRRLMVLDEPWKHLSVQYRPRVRDLVETLADEMDMQFVIVSHSDEFRMGKVVEL